MTPARLLAPAALMVAAIALFVVVTSGSDTPDTKDETSVTATPRPARGGGGDEPTPTPTAKAGGGGTYTVQPGDSPYSIAQETGVDMDALLEANPDADPNALRVGQKLKLP